MKRVLEFIIVAFFMATGCQEDHLYVYTVNAALYTIHQDNRYTVKYLGPKEIEKKTVMEPLTSKQIRRLYTDLAGHSMNINNASSPDAYSQPIPYCDFSFGLFHIEYWDSLSDSQRRGTKDFFLETANNHVWYYDHPEHYDIEFVKKVIVSAVPED